MKHKIAASVIVSALAGSCVWLAALAGWLPGLDGWLARQQYAKLAFMTDEQVPPIVQQIGALGEPGIVCLVMGLSHDRISVRDACEVGLRSRIDDWRRQPSAGPQPGIIHLAQQLAGQLPHGDRDALRRSLSLALLALDGPLPEGGSDSTALTYSCEQVIRAARTAGLFRELFAQPSEPTVETAEAPATSLVNHMLNRAANEPTPVDVSVGKHVDGTSVDRVPVDHALPDPNSGAQRLPLTAHGEPQRTFSQQPARLDESGGAEARSKGSAADEPLIALADIEVMRLLADESRRESARRELQRRGFGERELQVAAALVAPDPNVREQLAESLPLLSGIDPRPWLLLLARDDIAQVRAIAVRWLVTSNDLRIQEFLRELANQETDDLVRQALRRRPSASGIR